MTTAEIVLQLAAILSLFGFVVMSVTILLDKHESTLGERILYAAMFVVMAVLNAWALGSVS